MEYTKEDIPEYGFWEKGNISTNKRIENTMLPEYIVSSQKANSLVSKYCNYSVYIQSNYKVPLHAVKFFLFCDSSGEV